MWLIGLYLSFYVENDAMETILHMQSENQFPLASEIWTIKSESKRAQAMGNHAAQTRKQKKLNQTSVYILEQFLRIDEK